METTEFASPTRINMGGGYVGTVEYGGARNMVVMFYTRSIHNRAKSMEQGTPIYEDMIYVRIHPPGERLNIIDRPAVDSDKATWVPQWEAFQKKTDQTPTGTPVALLYPDQPSIADMLRASGVHTIEHLAILSGNAIDNIGMGAQQYVNAAQKWLAAAEKGAGIVQLRGDLEKKDREIKVLTQMVEALKANVESLTSELRGGNPTLASLQRQLSQVMERPQHMPRVAFDPQSDMINANHATAQPGTRRGRAVAKPAPEPAKPVKATKSRTRAKLSI